MTDEPDRLPPAPPPPPANFYGAAVMDQWMRGPIYQWWQHHVVETVDHAHVVKKIFADNDWTPRYLFLTLMSAGIARTRPNLFDLAIAAMLRQQGIIPQPARPEGARFRLVTPNGT